MDASNLKFTLGAVGMMILTIVSTVLYIGRVEAKAERAAIESTAANVAIKEINTQLRAQRELIAGIQGDSRAILQLLRLRSPSPSP